MGVPQETAEESIFYVALGKALIRDLVEKYVLTENNASGILSATAIKLVDEIRALAQ